MNAYAAVAATMQSGPDSGVDFILTFEGNRFLTVVC
jgi:hypothetical protein